MPSKSEKKSLWDSSEEASEKKPGAANEPWQQAELHPSKKQGQPPANQLRIRDTSPVEELPPVEPTRRLVIPDVEAPDYEPPPVEPTRRINVSRQPTSPTRPEGMQQYPPVEPTRRIKPPGQAEPQKPSPYATRRMPPTADESKTEPLPRRTPPPTSPTPKTRPVSAWQTRPVDEPQRKSPPPPPPPNTPPSTAAPQPDSSDARSKFNWAALLLKVTLGGVGIFFIGMIASIVAYIAIAAQLPAPEELRAREPNFASSQIYDREGKLLHEIIDPTAGKRTYVSISEISPNLKMATIATEDRNFYTHVGVDPIAVIRAVYYALQELRIVSGFSSITQQVARNILLPDEAAERSATRKIKEVVLAAELENRYSKDEILEVYLNNNNYGNLAYGIDAAARTYFGSDAANLTVSQAAFLAGMPQSPSTYDPYRGGLDAALRRHKIVLGLMVEDGYITAEEADAAAAEMEAYEFTPIFTDRIPAPHFIVYVKQWLEKEYGSEALYTETGLRIHTTLDTRLQKIAEEEVARGVEALAGRNVSNGALIALEPSSGHILAMVGSVDFYNNDIGGQVNIVQRCRQPGSAIKPLTYLTAFEKGWNPATVVWDLPVTYTDTAGNVYEPLNYDGKFRGPTTVRTALANSLNIPAVKTLEYVGVEGLLDMAERLGATSIVSPQVECPDYPYDTRPLYGLALTLGGGEMKPLELTAAYAIFANGGLSMPTTPILWIEDSAGNIILDNRTPEGERVISAELAYLITNVLSDVRARCLVFACPNNLELADRPVAAKTGSTNDTRDAWTVGYTPNIATGVWVGNNDNSPMADVLGSAGAGPIWNAFMRRAHEGITPHQFPRPIGIVEKEVCKLSGAEPSPYCPEKGLEIFDENNPPPKPEADWFQQIEIDSSSGLRANEFCRLSVVSKLMLLLDNVTDPGGREWLQQWAAQNGMEVAPQDFCTSGEQAPKVEISIPQNGEQVYGNLDIRGTVALENFKEYNIMYGIGSDPAGWGWISGPHQIGVNEGLLGRWQIPTDLPPRDYTLRVVAYNQQGAQFEARMLVNVVGPTVTPTPEISPTPSPSITPTPTASPTPTLTPTATPTQIPLTTPETLDTLTPEASTPTPTPEPTTAAPTEPPTTEPTETIAPPATETPTPEATPTGTP